MATLNSRLEKIEAKARAESDADLEFVFFVVLLDPEQHHIVYRENYLCVFAPPAMLDRFRVQHSILTNFPREKLDEIQAGGVEVALICNPALCDFGLLKWHNDQGRMWIEGFTFETVEPEHLRLWRYYTPGQFLGEMEKAQ